MSRHRTDPLRPLTADERQELTRLSRSLSAPTAPVRPRVARLAAMMVRVGLAMQRALIR